MALADIIQRIGNDSAAEAHAVITAAKARADELLDAARAEAAKATEQTLAAARRAADAEADTVRAAARLAARDATLAAKRELIDSTVAAAREAVVALPDAEYAEFMAARVAHAARGGERVLIAPADVVRLANRLPDVVAALGAPRLHWATELAHVDRGVVLVGDRVSVDLSVDAIVAERADELSMIAAAHLFGRAEA